MRRTVLQHGPDPIDVHVGTRLKLFRGLQRMSQERLGEELGITFQQIQKYERGSNRVSASMLYRAAQALRVPVSAFFEGLGDSQEGLPRRAVDRFSATMMAELKELPPEVREAIKALVRALARTTGKKTGHGAG
jgi:transcriptional regulator with XRE-family HTH domain